ncbi:ComEA family DNA-binding protein [Streptomyces sp. NBC_01104]|nr:ComEA family DNA-binding protein [Streptomyces sp. NBC_01104]
MASRSHRATTRATARATTRAATRAAVRTAGGAGSGPGRVPASDGRVRGGPGGSAAGPGRRQSRGRNATAAAAAASRSRADALMAGGYGGRVARPVLGLGAEASIATAVASSSPPVAAAVAGPGPAEVQGSTTGSASAGRWERAVPALRERLPVWLQLRCGLEPKTLAALTVVLVAAAVFAAMHFWSDRPASVRAPERVGEAAASGADADAGGPVTPEPSPGAAPAAGPGGPAGPAGSGVPGAQIVVDVGGKVRRPGIHRLPSGSRVADALRVAGGARPGVDLDGLNRARVLVDGEQIIVGAPPGPAAAGGTGAGTGGPAAASGASAGPVSLNSGTPEQFDTLPGVGPVLAQHIIDYRTQHGGFRSVDELREVNGIGDRRFADLQPLVRP